eukprot:TRINITY_DN41171_c0_g1_i1.p1 TRINITY_DN41171_c0_g1~~TRINITY_DN41171_c0_g1_i1.p1  ORF type:complete len:736 (+),score=170.55 TRINITY_DN41171_c0_g1_i1:102-2309(+)
MDQAAVPGRARLPLEQLQATLRLPEDDEDEFADDSTEGESPPTPIEIDGMPHTDELAANLLDREQRLFGTLERLRSRKKRLKDRLATYQEKEMEFVSQMDTHMDEVERTEHSLSLRIEQLTTDNDTLRTVTEKRARENSELADKLAETTKQCNESETRVQFLVDRIVALLSNGLANPQQTQAIVNLRQRERGMLQQLEDTRAQYDEVRQQNGELTSRLTEELALSRRLSDQLAEVEERFFHHRATAESQLPHLSSSERAARAGGAAPAPALSDGLGHSPPGMRSGCLGEVPFAERGPLGTGGGFQREEPAPADLLPMPPAKSRPPSNLGVVPEMEASLDPSQDNLGLSDELHESEMQESNEHSREGGQVWRSGAAATAEGLFRMEAQLRDALDRASFECAVVRIEPGVYSFGPSVQAVVELTADGEAIASQDGMNFIPIEEFIRNIANEQRLHAAAAEQDPIEPASVAAPTPPAGLPQQRPAATELPNGNTGPAAGAAAVEAQQSTTPVAPAAALPAPAAAAVVPPVQAQLPSQGVAKASGPAAATASRPAAPGSPRHSAHRPIGATTPQRVPMTSASQPARNSSPIPLVREGTRTSSSTGQLSSNSGSYVAAAQGSTGNMQSSSSSGPLVSSQTAASSAPGRLSPLSRPGVAPAGYQGHMVSPRPATALPGAPMQQQTPRLMAQQGPLVPSNSGAQVSSSPMQRRSPTPTAQPWPQAAMGGAAPTRIHHMAASR